MWALAFLLLGLSPLALGLFDPSEFPQSAFLDESVSYHLRWRSNETTKTVHFLVVTNTTGWSGLGLSESGGMLGADMAVWWIDTNGEKVFSDRNTMGFTTRHTPAYDKHTDWVLDGLERRGEHVWCEFHRLWETCDEEDVDIIFGTSRVLWAYRNGVPTDPTHIGQHDRMGSKSISLRSEPPVAEFPPKAADVIVLQQDIAELPVQKTTYYCKAFKLPTDSAYHIKAYRPSITPGNEGIVHHILLYECGQLTDDEANYEGACYEDANMPTALKECNGAKPVAAWAVGGGPFSYPDHVGYPMGLGGAVYVLMEVHYNMPNPRALVPDQSGLEIFYGAPRPIAAGILTLGGATPGILLPPGMKRAPLRFVAPPKCTAAFPDDGVKVIASLLHAHYTGAEIWTDRVDPAGVMTAPINADHNFDFNYQDFDHFPDPIVLKRGDSYYTTCAYRTTNRTGVTYGGTSTTDEMCLDYLVYWPRLPKEANTVFLSIPDVKELFATFLNSLVSEKLITPDQAVKTGEALINAKMVPDLMDKAWAAGGVTWTPAMADLFIKVYAKIPHYTACDQTGAKYSADPDANGVTPYNPPSTCAKPAASASASATPEPASEQKRKRRRIAVAVSVSLLLIAVAGAIAFIVRANRSPSPPPRDPEGTYALMHQE